MNEQNNATEITKIYLVTNCYGDFNKVYIGKTKNEISRKREHIFKYGEQALFDIIDEIKSWNKNDWKPLECKWIQHYKDLGYEVLNKNKGGSGSPCGIKRTKEFCNNLKIIHKGKLKSKEHKDKISKSLKNKPKPVGFGQKPKDFGEKVSKSNKGISKPKPSNFGDVISKLKKGKKQPLSFGISKSLFLKGNNYRSKPILQYDLEGNFIKEWKSVYEARREINNNIGGGIGECCREKQKTAYGYKWKYK